MIRKLAMALVAMSFLALSGCATILSGVNQELTFTSTPEGAEVLIDGNVMGVTPLTITVKKNSANYVQYRLPGYKETGKQLVKQVDPVAVLNIFWDLSTTDFLSGAIYEYAPGQYHVELTKQN